MPLYAGEMNLRRGAPLSEFPAPLSEVLRSQSEQTRIENPTMALQRLREMETAEGRTDQFQIDSEFEGTEGGAVTGRALTRRPMDVSPVTRLDAETARGIVKEEGLPLTIPDEGISREALDILVRRKRQELQRADVFARGPGGVGAGAARLGVAFYESLFDPLNIASAFVPVVGQARYAALLAGAAGAGGRAVVRAGIGAAEGMVGAAILEPLVYSAAKAEQADYGMADSLANIAFGGLFGGGLHAGGGAIRDVALPGWWRMAQTTDTRAPVGGDELPALRALEGAPVVREPVRAANAVDAIDSARRIAEAEVKPGFQRSAEDLIALKQDVTPEIQRAVEILKQPAFERSAEDRVFLAALEKGHEADYINARIGEALRQVQDIDQRLTRNAFSTINESAMAMKRPFLEQIEGGVQRLSELGRKVDEAELVMERVSPETRQAALKASVVQAIEGRQTAVDTLVRADPAVRSREQGPVQAASDVRASAEQNSRPDAIRSAEPRASTASDQTVRESKPFGAEAADAELENALTAANDFAAALGEPDRVKTGLEAYDQAIKRAKEYAKALRAGAACGLA